MAKKIAKTQKPENVAGEYMTIREAAALLAVYEKTVSNWFDRGIIEGKRSVLGNRKPLRSSITKIKQRMDTGWRPPRDS